MKRSYLLTICILLAAVISIGGTMAYLTDSDSDVNVMTLGKVDIKQIEQQRDANGGLVDFQNQLNFLPGVYEGDEPQKDNNGLYALSTNARDKIVSVKNIGKTDAYVRTWFGFEQGSMSGDEFAQTMIINFSGDEKWVVSGPVKDFELTKDGVTKKYTVYLATYQDVLKPQETTVYSLLQVLMSKTADNAEMDALDPDGDGEYNIEVVSQAVQAEGFSSAETALEEAFGSDFPGATQQSGEETLVGTEAELKAALAAGGNVKLTADIKLYGDLGESTMLLTEEEPEEKLESYFATNKDIVLDLNGKTLTLAGKRTVGETVTDAGGTWQINGGNVTICDTVGGGKITQCDDPSWNYGTIVQNAGTLTLKSGTIENLNRENAISSYDSTLNIEGGKVTANPDGGASFFLVGSTTTISGGTVENTNPGKYVITFVGKWLTISGNAEVSGIIHSRSDADGTIVVTDWTNAKKGQIVTIANKVQMNHDGTGKWQIKDNDYTYQ